MKLRIVWNGMEWNGSILNGAPFICFKEKCIYSCSSWAQGRVQDATCLKRDEIPLDTTRYALSFVIWRGLDLLVHVLCQTWRKCTRTIWFPFTEVTKPSNFHTHSSISIPACSNDSAMKGSHHWLPTTLNGCNAFLTSCDHRLHSHRLSAQIYRGILLKSTTHKLLGRSKKRVREDGKSERACQQGLFLFSI